MSLIRSALFAIAAMALVAGCSDKLTYGERSGFNLAIRADAAQNVPIEVNGGFQRRVVGLIPPSGRTEDGDPSGEAVNMFSNFDLHYDENDTSLFRGKLTIGSSFASGAAALALARKIDAVEQIVRPTHHSIPDDPAVRVAVTALGDFIAANDGQRETYMQLARARGLAVAGGGDPGTNAINTVDDPQNGQKNIEIADFLGLI